MNTVEMVDALDRIPVITENGGPRVWMWASGADLSASEFLRGISGV